MKCNKVSLNHQTSQNKKRINSQRQVELKAEIKAHLKTLLWTQHIIIQRFRSCRIFKNTVDQIEMWDTEFNQILSDF